MNSKEQAIREVVEKFKRATNSINYESKAFRERLVREIVEALEKIENE